MRRATKAELWETVRQAKADADALRARIAALEAAEPLCMACTHGQTWHRPECHDACHCEEFVSRVAALEGVASGLKASLDSVTAAWDKEFKATEALQAQLAAALQRAEAAEGQRDAAYDLLNGLERSVADEMAALRAKAEAGEAMARWLRSPIDQVGSWTCECCGAYNEHVAPEPERHKADCPVGRYRAAGGQG